MSSLFKVLGLVLALYLAYAIVRGSVYAKSGAGGRRVTRADSPGYFWAVVGVYAALSAALLLVF